MKRGLCPLTGNVAASSRLPLETWHFAKAKATITNMTKPTTALALPPAIQKHQPRPTKAQIIEALAVRKQTQLIAERDAAQAKLNAANEALEKSVITHVMANIATLSPKASLGYIYGENGERLNGMGVSIELDNPPPHIVKARRASKRLFDAIPHVPEFKHIKRSVADAMAGESNVDAMLKDAGMVKALDKMLSTLDKKAQTAIA